MSTVSSTSAGLLAPSVLMRCSRPELAEITLTLMPVSLVKASNSGWISLALAIGVDVDLALGERGARGGERADDGEMVCERNGMGMVLGSRNEA